MWIRIYARRSRALGDPTDYNLFEHQVNPLLRLAAQDGHRVPGEHVVTEVGSGETMEQRPSFLALWKEQQQMPEPGLLYATEPARVSRGDMEEVGRITRVFRRAGVKMRTPGQTYDLTNHDDEMIWGLLSIVAHHGLEQARDRFRRKTEEMIREGRVLTGKVAYGYCKQWDKNTKRPVPDPVTFPILQSWCRDIFTHTLRDLERRDGVHSGKISATLRNPMIAGRPARRHFKHGGRREWATQVYERVGRDRWTMPERDGDYPPACTWEEWLRIQVVLDGRILGKERQAGAEGWCRDRLRFHTPAGTAEGTVGLGPKRGPDRSVLFYQLTRPGHAPLYHQRDPIHAAVTAALAALFAEPSVLAAALSAALAAEAERQQAIGGGDRQATLRGEIIRERERLDRTVDAELDAEDAEHRASLARRRAEIEARLGLLKEELESLRKPSPLTQASRFLPEQLGDVGCCFSDWWQEQSVHTRRHVTATLIGAVDLFVDQQLGGRTRREIQRVTFATELTPHLPRRFQKGIKPR